MGLCKCPKKKVTNLFCFEHRVNVCEYCLVETHNKCVVQSYLSWLADSDYDPNCSLCSRPLEDKETVRLKCLHLFHWECLDAWAKRMPANTAPAGYKCPMCQEGVFPAPNQTSPLIEQLRSFLQKTNWARAGLGLSLLPDLVDSQKPTPFSNATSMSNYAETSAQPDIHASSNQAGGVRSGTPATVVDVADDYKNPDQQSHFTARRTTGYSESEYESMNPLLSRPLRDEDLPENKYKRRAPSEWLSRWLRTRYGRRATLDPRARWKRCLFHVFIVMIVIMTLFTILSRIISKPQNDDPAFNPLANPDIRVALPDS